MAAAAVEAKFESAEIASYLRNGYLVPRWRLPAGLLGHMQAALECLIADSPDIRPENLVLRWGGGETALPAHATFLDLVRSPDLLDLVAPILGPDLICWGAHAICKPPRDGWAVPWHQDSHFWPIRPMATCTVWVALDPSTRANGCLRVIPGSHKAKVSHPHRAVQREGQAFEDSLEDSSFVAEDAVDLVLEPGQVSIHDAYLIHGSNPNRSAQRRAGLAIRYMPATSLWDRSSGKAGASADIRQDMARRPIYLVRGQDRAGNDFTIGQDRPFAVG